MRLSERTIAGLERARSQGRVGGRPRAEDDAAKMKTFRRLKARGLSVRKIAVEMAISPTTVQKLSGVAS